MKFVLVLIISNYERKPFRKRTKTLWKTCMKTWKLSFQQKKKTRRKSLLLNCCTFISILRDEIRQEVQCLSFGLNTILIFIFCFLFQQKWSFNKLKTENNALRRQKYEKSKNLCMNRLWSTTKVLIHNVLFHHKKSQINKNLLR